MFGMNVMAWNGGDLEKLEDKDQEKQTPMCHSLTNHHRPLRTNQRDVVTNHHISDFDENCCEPNCVDNLSSWLGDDQALSSLIATGHHSLIDYFIPNVSAASEATTPDVYGWLAAYINLFESLASSSPVLKLMTWLQDIHAVLGVPWWLSIILTTVALRTVITLPLALYQQRVIARVELLKTEMLPLMQCLADETRAAKLQLGWDERTAQLYFRRLCRKSWNELVVRDNCHPGKGVVLLLGQLPLWIMLSVSLRNLALCYPVPSDAALVTQQQFSTEGLPWCPDLSVPDLSLVLPLSMALVNLVITEISVLQRPQVSTTAGVRRMTWVLRGFAIITVPIAIYMPAVSRCRCINMPAGVVLYWVTSSGCALMQTLLLMHPRVRLLAGIPLTPSTQLHPYSRIASIAAMKIRGQEVPRESAPVSFELPPENKKKL
ncbi:Membrane insertase OXA1/ALB3/YidC [Trinorchestia longiramus]|nr:Membrane insertase OXA1/ALB3/YidC [Trinorchestia longiramus]